MSSFQKLWPYLRPHWILIACSATLAIPLSAIRLGPAPVVKYMLDEILSKGNLTQLYLFPLALIGLYVLNFFVRFAHYYLLRKVIIRTHQHLKNDLLSHILGLSVDHFTRESTGTWMSRVNADPQLIDAGLGCINLLIREPITLIFLFSYALYLNWRLTIITLVLAPFLALVFSRSGKILKRYLNRLSEINGALYSTLQESLAGIRTIHLFRLEKEVFRKFAQQNELYARFLLKTSLVEEIAHPLVELLTALALAPLIYYGGLQVIQGSMTAGDLFAFFTTFAMMMNPIRSLNDINMKLHQTAAASQRIFQTFLWESSLTDPAKGGSQPPHAPAAASDPVRFDLSLEHVSFAYPDAPQRAVLKDIDFQIAQGQVVAMVGESGAGKSSLAQLIPRLFDVSQGRICIGGCDIRQFSLEKLRSMISVVSQDVFLFNDTLAENIRYGKLSATPQDIRRAAQRADALSFIDQLPEGLESRIGDRGQKLSGGERQRISIARAFLREAPLLILDEATSSLDSASELAVQKALSQLMKHRTTLIIAHRLSTIEHADLILVLKDGEIIEQGRHAELMQLNQAYARFQNIRA